MALKPMDWLASTRVGHAMDVVSFYVVPVLVRLASLMHVITYNDDVQKAPNDRAKVLWEEAMQRGIVMRQLIFFGQPLDAYQARVNGRTIIFDGLPIPIHLRKKSLAWLDNKLQLKQFLQSKNIPVPRGGSFTQWTPMLRFFQTLEKPVIVKPAIGSRGRHTTTFIYTEEELKQAFLIGKQISRTLVMEEHLIGSVYRATIIDGKLIGILRGDPPRITGDETQSISELIGEKNKNHHERIHEYKISDLTQPFLARNNYTLDTILEKGITIDLSEKVGITYGGYSAEEIDITHPDTKKILTEAGRLIAFPIIGFDFIIPDITKNPAEQKWGIIECNSLPFIDLHHHPIEGTPINAAGAVWDLWN